MLKHFTEKKLRRRLSSNEAILLREQRVLSEHQTNIVNRLADLVGIQSNLDLVSSNILVQQTNLSDVQYWINNLFANEESGDFTYTDTNHLKFVKFDDSTFGYVIRIDKVPIENSLTGYVLDTKSGLERSIEQRKGTKYFNLFVSGLVGYNPSNVVFHVRYVADTRATNIYLRMPNDKEITLSPAANGVGQCASPEDVNRTLNPP